MKYWQCLCSLAIGNVEKPIKLIFSQKVVRESGFVCIKDIFQAQSQTNYVVHAEPRTVPGRTIVYCLKTMARQASPTRALCRVISLGTVRSLSQSVSN